MTENIEQIYNFLYHLIKKETNMENSKVAALASQFSSLDSFYGTDFTKQKFIRADRTEVKISNSQREKIQLLKEHITSDSTLNENWIRYLAHCFVKTQIKNIRQFTLESMNMNPFLLKALKLQTPEDAIRFNVYQSATRSIVTSMGFCLESMVGHSGCDRMGNKGEWFDVVKEISSLTYWIQVKSGPNDVDKDQVKHFNPIFNETESTKGNLTRLGITYGKRTMNTISMNHIKSYLDKWEERILVGKELWDFVSGETDYHRKVLKWIDETSSNFLQGRSISQEIEDTIIRMISQFVNKYGEGTKGLSNYIDESL